MDKPKREFIEYMKVLDDAAVVYEVPFLTDSEVLQQTAYVYLSTGQIFKILKWSVCGKIGSLFRSALRTFHRRKATR